MHCIAGLARDYRDDIKLKISFYGKLLVVIPGIIAIICLGILMGVCSNRTPPGGSDYVYCNDDDSASASLEWFVTSLFCLYILTMIFDLYPSRYTSTHRRGGEEPRTLIQPTKGVIQPKVGFFGRSRKAPHASALVPVANVASANGAIPSGAIATGRAGPTDGSTLV